jgi:hypothetical protein
MRRLLSLVCLLGIMSATASEAMCDADMHQSTLQPQPQPSLAYQHAPALQLGDAVAALAISENAGSCKRKRGRPRKCDLDLNLAMPLAIVSALHPRGFSWRPRAPASSTVPRAPPPSPVSVTQQVYTRRVRARSTTANKEGPQVAAAGISSGVLLLCLFSRKKFRREISKNKYYCTVAS